MKSFEGTMRNLKDKKDWLKTLNGLKNFDVLDNQGNSPLTISAFYGHLPGTEFILQNGGSIDFCNGRDETPLFVAIDSFFTHYKSGGIKEVIHYLINSGANIHLANEDGVTPLMKSLECDNGIDISLALIDRGASVSACDGSGTTVLMYAAGSKNLTLYNKVLEKGADVNASDRSGRNALYYLANVLLENSKERETVEAIMERLIQKGITVTSCDSGTGNTILHLAAFYGFLDLLKKCLEMGVEINVQNLNGETPLIRACINRQIAAFKSLLNQQPDINIKDHTGKNALDYARINKLQFGSPEFELALENAAS